MWPSLCCFCGGGVREKSSGGGGGGRGPSSSTATVKFEEDAADSSTRDTGGEVGPNTKSDSPLRHRKSHKTGMKKQLSPLR